jgi:flagellar protein FlgJ
MTISNASVYTDFNGLAELKAGGGKDSPETLRAVARQFESIFTQMMLKSMRDANLGEGLFDNDQSRMYMDMFDKQVSLEMSSGKGLGLADMMVRQLSPDTAKDGANGPKGLDDYFARPVHPLATSNQTAGAVSGSRHGGNATLAGGVPLEQQQAFVAELLPSARAAANKLGVAPDVLIAQAALETGWGTRVITDASGASSHNYFNIKADTGWSGKSVSVSTTEYRGGKPVAVQSDFRAFDSVEQAFDSYVSLIQNSDRYRGALAHGAGDNYIQAIHRAGYATDPEYVNKIDAIMNGASFQSMLDVDSNISSEAI